MRHDTGRAPWLGLLMTTFSALSSAPLPAAAQQTVIVTGKTDAYDARRDDTTARLVVGRDELDRYGDSNLVDVLRRQSGITVGSATPGQASAGEIRMRGLGQGYTQILVDGKPVPAGFSIDSLVPGQLERIEIIRSATADMSGQAIAGTINLVLRTRARTRERQLNLTAEGSDVFFSPIAGLRLADKLDGMAYSLNAELRRGRFRQPYTTLDDASDAGGRPLLARSAEVHNNGGFDRVSLDPAVSWTRNGGDSIGVKGNFQLGRNDSHSDSTWQARLGGLPDYPFEETRPSGHRRFGQGKLNWHHGLDGGAALDTEAGVSAGSDSADSAGIGGPRRDAITLRRDVLDDRRDHGWTWSGKLNLPLSDAHNIAAGWEANDKRSTVTQDERDAFAGQDPLTTLDRYRAAQRDVALYAQDEWTMSAAWSAYLGLRWQTLEIDSAGSDIRSSDGSDGNFTLARSFHVASPVLQLRWKLPGKDQNQFRLALTRTYKAPELERLLPQVTRSINNTVVDPDRIGNPALAPELANGLDLAFEHFGKDGLTWSVSPYLRHIDGFIRDELQLVDGRWTVRPINSGHARSLGVEADAKAGLGHWFAPLKAFELRANAARNWSEVSSVPGPDNRLADQVRYSGTLGLDYAPGGPFSAGGSFNLRSGGRLALSPTTSTYKTVQRNLDLYGLWRVDKGDSLRFSVNNLLAQPATSSNIYEDGAGRRESRSVYPFSPIGRVVWEHHY